MRVPPRILIADDQPMNVDILQTRLAVHGYELLIAADGEEALGVARAQLPDLILLDIMMPKMDGLEVCRQLKADKNLPFIPIIAVTSYALSGDDARAFEAGCDAYVTKPYSPRALLAKIREFLS